MSTHPLAPQPPSTASCQPDPRMQSAMVLFALEQAIGSYVTENTPDLETLPAGVRQAHVSTCRLRSACWSNPRSRANVNL